MEAMKEVLDIDASGSVVLLNGSAIFDNDPCAMFRTHNCHVCDSPPADGQKLQKCKGCNIALYCSRSCQKSAWETHRFFCRQTTTTRRMHRAIEEAASHDGEDVTSSASEVPLIGLSGFNMFHLMHSWAIKTMCQASLHLMKGGRGAESSRHNPMIMRFEVFPSQDPNAKPWNAWILDEWRSRPLNDFLRDDASFAKAWNDMKTERERQEAKDKIRFGSRFVGELPVLFYVEKTNCLLIMLYPILKLREPDALQDPESRGALEDLILLCLGYTNLGIPLGQMGTCEQLAFPGRMVREKKEWAWLPRGTMERPWDKLYIEIFRRLGRKTDLPPMDLMLLFWNLTAETYCPGIVFGSSDDSPEARRRPVLPTQHTRIR
ncbi:hypothetical protein K466DRAFT_565949 [Polyporus arcularius HHB13444]|uniref:MYND-type domain-containing protein n=1 Tax=Polyporus arcularius HHB13444 TaxID=1314778 RepID=A0A5C3PD57_9APHY|nr:hypothetical protein K466DRAFT_565949 [Polyporus arcularius HHB13444]